MSEHLGAKKAGTCGEGFGVAQGLFVYLFIFFGGESLGFWV